MTIQDEFISTVSHEMRTPLTSIRGFSQTLLTSWDRIDDENKKKFIKIIEEQSNRLINLVENILTVSKANTSNIIMKKVYVNASIRSIIPIFQEQYKKHKFIFEPQKDLPSTRLDDDKFQQIMTNLIDNAGKYSPEGTTVKITTEAKGEFVIIKVKDEGVGIKQGDADKLFKKFSRIENHLTSKTQGNGLGLYITKRLVESMNGQITFESEENKGTTFIVSFPIYNEEEALKCSQKS
jgi:signal transduction histidine kinase